MTVNIVTHCCQFILYYFIKSVGANVWCEYVLGLERRVRFRRRRRGDGDTRLLLFPPLDAASLPAAPYSTQTLVQNKRNMYTCCKTKLNVMMVFSHCTDLFLSDSDKLSDKNGLHSNKQNCMHCLESDFLSDIKRYHFSVQYWTVYLNRK